MAQRGVMANIFWTIFILGACMYGAICLYLFFAQAKLIYYPNVPSRKLTANPGDAGLHYESVTLSTSDHVKLHGWFIPAQDEKGFLLFFHGNAGNISHRLDSLKIFHDLGLSVLIIDYRGYGLSQGSVSEHGTYLDAEAAWSYLTESRKIPAQEIVVFGRSLGAAVAANIAARNTPGALILESAFTSIPDMGAKLYPFFPVRVLSRFKYDTKKALQSVSCPVLIIHSRDDMIIPFDNGLQLYKSSSEPKRFLEIHGDHNGGFLESGKVYTDNIREFIAANLAAPELRKEEPAKDDGETTLLRSGVLVEGE
jgi:fermentation-respiration switch protein FrsA (DUF1100 family)